MNHYRRFLKPLFDFTVSLIGLLMLFPLLLAIGLLVLFTSPGPAFYRQVRVGQNGDRFKILKFRTMYLNSDESSISVKGERRITPLGGFLRKYKLDELPELWNVLCGHMSMVGPRPDVPGYADKLKGNDRKILKLKPGITGPASIIYFNEEELLSKHENPIEYNNKIIYPHKVKINLWYYDHISCKLDIQIIFYTVFRNNAADRMLKIIEKSEIH